MRTKVLQVGAGIDHRDTHPGIDLDRPFLRRRKGDLRLFECDMHARSPECLPLQR
jgi:hypothetical protein